MEEEVGQNASAVDVSSSIADNVRLPIHRWYRYTAGFSAEWVGNLLERETRHGHVNVIDPFAGFGTVLVEGLRHNVNAVGLEANPYVHRIAQAKLSWANMGTDAIRACASRLIRDFHILFQRCQSRWIVYKQRRGNGLSGHVCPPCSFRVVWN